MSSHSPFYVDPLPLPLPHQGSVSALQQPWRTAARHCVRPACGCRCWWTLVHCTAGARETIGIIFGTHLTRVLAACQPLWLLPARTSSIFSSVLWSLTRSWRGVVASRACVRVVLVRCGLADCDGVRPMSRLVRGGTRRALLSWPSCSALTMLDCTMAPPSVTCCCPPHGRAACCRLEECLVKLRQRR